VETLKERVVRAREKGRRGSLESVADMVGVVSGGDDAGWVLCSGSFR
jgi:hypothetical protein